MEVDTHPNVFDCWTYSKEHRLKRDIDTYVIRISGCFNIFSLFMPWKFITTSKDPQQKLQFVGQFQFQVFLPFCGQGKWWHYPMVWLISYNFKSVIVISWVLEWYIYIYIYRLVYIYIYIVIASSFVWYDLVISKTFGREKSPTTSKFGSDSVLVVDGSTADDGP